MGLITRVVPDEALLDAGPRPGPRAGRRADPRAGGHQAPAVGRHRPQRRGLPARRVAHGFRALGHRGLPRGPGRRHRAPRAPLPRSLTPQMPLGIVSYGAYLPRHRLQRAELGAALGASAGKGARVVASYDEDSTTMGVEAARRALANGARPGAIHFATTSPAYFDKTNASAIHAALDLGHEGFAVDLAGSARGATGALRAAAASGGLAVLSDVRTGRPGSADERDGGDGAAAFLFGEARSDRRGRGRGIGHSRVPRPLARARRRREPAGRSASASRPTCRSSRTRVPRRWPPPASKAPTTSSSRPPTPAPPRPRPSTSPALSKDSRRPPATPAPPTPAYGSPPCSTAPPRAR